MAGRLRRLVAVGVALIVGAGCQTVPEGAGDCPLTPMSPSAKHFSDSNHPYEPNNPYKPSKDGVAERWVFTNPEKEGYAIEVRDLLVSAAQQEADLGIYTAAVFAIERGTGEAEIGEQTLKLRPGTIFKIDAGDRLRVTAYDEPLALRTWIVLPEEEKP